MHPANCPLYGRSGQQTRHPLLARLVAAVHPRAARRCINYERTETTTAPASNLVNRQMLPWRRRSERDSK